MYLCSVFLEQLMSIDSFFDSFRAVIQSPKKFVVVSHMNPDGDAIGSTLAMTAFLSKIGHEVHAMVPNDYPGFLSWMPGITDLLVYEKQTKECKTYISQADYVIMLDFNNLKRIGPLQNDIENAHVPLILIDHHREPDLTQFYCAYSEMNTSSASELVTQVILHFGEDVIDETIATDLMVGIMTDTGSFSHSIFHPQTFVLCAALAKKSMPYNQIHNLVYDTFSENRLRLLGYAIGKMEVLDEYATAIIALTKEDLESFDYQLGDTEGVVNYPLSMEKIKMSVLITERQGQVRLSFRSKDDFSVHELANAHFNGGGHTNAAGATVYTSFQETVDLLKSVLPMYQEKLCK